MSRARTIAAGTVLGAAAAISTVSTAFAFGGRGFGGGPRRGFMIFPMLLLIGLVALLIVLWRGRHLAPTTPGAPPPPPPVSPTFNAQAILADRLARGEITPEEYRAAVSVLRETPPLG